MQNSIDVLIPVYNGEKTVCRAIKSILDQTNINIQNIIVVDDGSTDQSCQIIESLKIPNLHLIKTKNRGVSAARNYGLTFVKSEWVAFLDCDDEWDKNKLHKQMTSAVDQDVGFICCAIDNKKKTCSKRININSLYSGNFIATSSVILKIKNYSASFPLFDEKKSFAEDYAAWIKVLSLSDGYFISEKLVNYTLLSTPNYKFKQSIFGLITLYYSCFHSLSHTNWSFSRKLFSLVCVSVGITRSVFSSIRRYISNF